MVGCVSVPKYEIAGIKAVGALDVTCTKPESLALHCMPFFGPTYQFETRFGTWGSLAANSSGNVILVNGGFSMSDALYASHPARSNWRPPCDQACYTEQAKDAIQEVLEKNGFKILRAIPIDNGTGVHLGGYLLYLDGPGLSFVIAALPMIQRNSR
jgi:hypothetical protein